MSLLDHPDAQVLLADAALTPEAVEGCQDHLAAFLQRYLPRFYRVEHRAHAGTVIHGLLSGLQRKTCEPIAYQAGLHRKTEIVTLTPSAENVLKGDAKKAVAGAAITVTLKTAAGKAGQARFKP